MDERQAFFLLHHESAAKLGWDVAMMFLIMWSSVVNPLQLGKSAPKCAPPRDWPAPVRLVFTGSVFSFRRQGYCRRAHPWLVLSTVPRPQSVWCEGWGRVWTSILTVWVHAVSALSKPPSTSQSPLSRRPSGASAKPPPPGGIS